jgi:hypothetical protein
MMLVKAAYSGNLDGAMAVAILASPAWIIELDGPCPTQTRSRAMTGRVLKTDPRDPDGRAACSQNRFRDPPHFETRSEMCIASPANTSMHAILGYQAPVALYPDRGVCKPSPALPRIRRLGLLLLARW